MHFSRAPHGEKLFVFWAQLTFDLNCHPTSITITEEIDRSEGFPNGIFHPCTLWDGGLARWKNCRRAVAAAAAVVGVTWKSPGKGHFNSFSFRAWISLIWEISGHLSDQSSWFFGARLFCKHTKKSGFNDIYNIQFFQDTYSQNGFFRKCCT